MFVLNLPLASLTHVLVNIQNVEHSYQKFPRKVFLKCQYAVQTKVEKLLQSAVQLSKRLTPLGIIKA